MKLDHTAVHLKIDSGHLRVALRAYFTVLFILVGFIGNRCCASRVKLRLLRKGEVNFVLATGWLPGFTALTTAVEQRRLPGGWIGVAMILAGVLAMLSDFIVTGFVRTVQVPGRCNFTTGVVLPIAPVTWRSDPGNQQRSYTIVSQAQLTSQSNGGIAGIYWKANADLNFRATSEDVVGSWNCTDIQHDIGYAANTTGSAILTSLQQMGYLYNTSTGCWNNYPDHSTSDLLFWGASVGDDVESPWDVRVSMDVTRKGPHNPVLMKSFKCSMYAPKAEWVLSKINSESTLSQWCLGLYGDLEERINATGIIETTLNSMIMVGYGGGVGAKSPPIGDATQGCLTPYTSVPWPVYTLLVLATTCGVLISIFYLILLALTSLRFAGSAGHNPTVLRKDIPIGLLGWMAQAIKEREPSVEITPKDFKDWRLVRSGTEGLSINRV
ncbi:hypothetical protein F5882DRAFT_444401 [Hyaloscypha sp. PMI_1271]|nr:hypothetical protein F5882DRAFT_444401 [Hyaloscypha sp. PMI_1271]